jgi:hypothetical protein
MENTMSEPRTQRTDSFAPASGRIGICLVAAAVAVVILATVGVTGFLAPGFLRGEEHDHLISIANARHLDDPTALLDQLSDAVQNRDTGTLKQTVCVGPSRGLLRAIIDRIGHAPSARVTQVKRLDHNDTILVELRLGRSGGSEDYLAAIRHANNDWCWMTGIGGTDSVPAAGS